jgi:hypothetical protein
MSIAFILYKCLLIKLNLFNLQQLLYEAKTSVISMKNISML